MGQRLSKDVIKKPASAELRSSCINNVVGERAAERVCDVAGEPAAEESSASHVMLSPSSRGTQSRHACIGAPDSPSWQTAAGVGVVSSRPRVAGRDDE